MLIARGQHGSPFTSPFDGIVADSTATPMSLTPGARIGPYEIVALVGAGGMGEVYRAHDTKLNRPVAVKFLSEDLANASARRRFQREAEMASALNHPHILTVHDAGEHEGRQYLVTEFIDGGTLRDWFRAEKRTWRQIAELLVGVADGLATAHSAGILHRDIKPENILVTTSGYAKVVDFGLAKLDDHSTLAPSTLAADRTRTGILVGTIPYMSPEQAAGTALDARSDIFSFGVVLYELLAGRRPFAGVTTPDVLHAIVHGIPEPLPPDVPNGLRAAVEKALEKDPGERYQSMHDLAVDLRRVGRLSGEVTATIPAPRRVVSRGKLVRGLAVAAAIGVAIAIAISLRIAGPPPAPTARDSIAVLPFRNIGASPEAEYFAEGISDDITAQLSKLPGIRVVAGTSVRRFRDSQKSPGEIGQELGVATLLAGSVRLSAQNVRVVVELLDCATSLQISAETFDRPLKDVFATQTEIAQRVGAALKGQLSRQEARSLERKPINPQAFQLYLQGRYHWNKRTPEGLRRSVDFFKEATLADPDAALLHAGLSDAYLLSGIYDVLPTADAQRLAEESALRAVRLDATLPEAQTTLGSVRQEQFQWNEAQASFQRAIELNPNYAAAHHWYALLLAAMGQFEAARTHMHHALAVDPLSLTFTVALGYVLYVEGDFAGALRQYTRGLELEADHAWVHRQIAMAHEAQGKYADALGSLTKAEVGSPRKADLNAIRASVYALAGQRNEASRLLADIERVAEREPVAGAEMALAYFALDEPDRAYYWLDRAIAARENDVQYLAVDPRYRFVRQQQGFQQRLRKLGLPQEAGR